MVRRESPRPKGSYPSESLANVDSPDSRVVASSHPLACLWLREVRSYVNGGPPIPSDCPLMTWPTLTFLTAASLQADSPPLACLCALCRQLREVRSFLYVKWWSADPRHAWKGFCRVDRGGNDEEAGWTPPCDGVSQCSRSTRFIPLPGTGAKQGREVLLEVTSLGPPGEKSLLPHFVCACDGGELGSRCVASDVKRRVRPGWRPLSDAALVALGA
jgi:hypothetical protein